MHKWIDEIESLLAPYGARRLSSKQIAKYEEFSFGWFLEENLDAGFKARIALLFSQQFPYETPRVYLVKPELKPLQIPHLETNGKLCVWAEPTIPDTSNLDFIIELLTDAFVLLNQAFNNELDDDFKDEFLSYWFYNSDSEQRVKSLCSISNKSPREIYVFKSSSVGIVCADTREQLQNYLENRKLLPSKDRVKARSRILSRIHVSLFIHFKTPWAPTNYPKNISQFLTLIQQEYPEIHDELTVKIGQTLSNRYIICPVALVSFDTSRGSCIAALEFAKSVFTQESFTNKSIMNGFRGCIPIQPLKDRMSTVKITGSTLIRHDPNWTLGRDQNKALLELQKCRVAIIGCGSVGASIARFIVQSGVQSLILFDGDILKSENISRHLLGVSFENNNKAKALAQNLRQDFPHVEVIAYEGDWQQIIYSNSQALTLLDRSDLIVSCTGNWQSDQSLLALQSNNTLATIIFAFVEAHAMAAHVVVNPVDSKAFNSLHHQHGNQVGKMLITATSWEEQTKITVPACAGVFQPYGVVPLTHLHAMASEVALSLLIDNLGSQFKGWRKVWFGSKKQLKLLGGDWNKEWCRNYRDPNNGKLEMTFSFDGKDWTFVDGEI